jgi:4-hydroxyphenylpyruvate dioxygenase
MPVADLDLPIATPAGLKLTGVDHVEFYVGNAKQAAHYYRTAFGFAHTGYRGPETGVRDRVSYLLEQGQIRFVLTAPLRPEGELAEHVHRHGDGVKAIALAIEDPREWPEIPLYGDTVHRFVRPGETVRRFHPLPADPLAKPTGLRAIDHIVGNVGWGEMDRWVSFYRDILGFDLYQSFDDKDISTEYSALMSKVMANGNGRVKFPINEPATGRRRSQIEEFLDYYGGPGVQHIAMLTGDIVSTVTKLAAQGVEFLRVPAAYYDELSRRVGRIDEPLEELARLGILVDRDEEGYMLQIFTKPVEDRPTVFFEIIQRKGSRSFGKGNFKALFEAMEREQEKRGNL